MLGRKTEEWNHLLEKCSSKKSSRLHGMARRAEQNKLKPEGERLEIGGALRNVRPGLRAARGLCC